MKTKDIMKILKLVKKSRKHKKRKRHHNKKKVIITPTQNILQSKLQPYEISRQVPMTNSNNIGQVLDSSRLTNTLLENKIREGSDMSTKINDINNKLLLYDANANNFNNRVDDVNRRLIGYDNKTQIFSNLITDVNQKLVGYDANNQAFNNMFVDVNSKLSKQEYDNRLSNQFVNTSISRVQNYNKNLENKIDDIYNIGPHLINDAIERKFKSQKLIDNKKNKIDGSDDDDDEFEDEPETKNDDDKIDELLITPPGTPPDTQPDTPLEPPPNIQSPEPPPKLTKEEKKQLKENKEYNKTIDSIINKINKDIVKNGDTLTTETKTLYKGMLKGQSLKFSNATKSKTSLINSLSSQKKKI